MENGEDDDGYCGSQGGSPTVPTSPSLLPLSSKRPLWLNRKRNKPPASEPQDFQVLFEFDYFS